MKRHSSIKTYGREKRRLSDLSDSDNVNVLDSGLGHTVLGDRSSSDNGGSRVGLEYNEVDGVTPCNNGFSNSYSNQVEDVLHISDQNNLLFPLLHPPVGLIEEHIVSSQRSSLSRRNSLNGEYFDWGNLYCSGNGGIGGNVSEGGNDCSGGSGWNGGNVFEGGNGCSGGNGHLRGKELSGGNVYVGGNEYGVGDLSIGDQWQTISNSFSSQVIQSVLNDFQATADRIQDNFGSSQRSSLSNVESRNDETFEWGNLYGDGNDFIGDGRQTISSSLSSQSVRAFCNDFAIDSSQNSSPIFSQVSPLHAEDPFFYPWESNTPICSPVLSQVSTVNDESFFVYPGEINFLNLTIVHTLGKFNVKCPYCGAIFFPEEVTNNRFTKCCAGGSIKVTLCDSYPTYLHDLFSNSSTDSNHFKEYIRQYNSAFAFVSFGHKPDPRPGRGPYCFNVLGTIYHRIAESFNPDLTSNHDEIQARKYCQMYILDGDDATRARMSHPANECLHLEIMECLETMLREINPYASILKMMKELEKEESDRARRENRLPSELTMCISTERGDIRNFAGSYNAITANEVAIVYSHYDENEPPGFAHRAIHSKSSNKLQTLAFHDGRIDSFTYPLFFPDGKIGWTPKMPCRSTFRGVKSKRKRETVSMQEYYRHVLSTRDSSENFSPLLFGGKLTDQFVCDIFLRIEGSRMQWVKHNQATLRVDTYLGLHDHLRRQATNRHSTVGKVCVLPSSVTGSPRYMQKCYLDAMAMVRELGHPDFFVTMTCNPNWKEIQENLGFGRNANERKDICVRVFKRKLEELINLIESGTVLGKVVAYNYSIEFQKRGLPHAHIIVICDKDWKPQCAADVDRYVSAQIPDKTKHPELYDRVRDFMIHTPCGEVIGGVCCVDDGKGKLVCKKKFPKPYQDETKHDVNSFPLYKRRDNRGKCEPWKGKLLDNSWVVPYNPFLLMKFNCHINVEVISTIHAVKYIYKYCFKGVDKLSIKVVEGVLNYDEVQHFIDSRYLCPAEAMWRIFEFETHGRSHVIIPLSVHEPLKHGVVFREGEEQRKYEEASKKDTHLMAFFKLNSQDPFACSLLYEDIPRYYSWNESKCAWGKRVRGFDSKVIPRIHTTNPRDVERESIRMLLLHVKGPKSFDDLKTIDGEVQITFRVAVEKLGLVKNANYWRDIMQEAAMKMFPSGMRDLVVTLCSTDDPSFARQCWEEFKEDLVKDYVHEGNSLATALNLGLQYLGDGLEEVGLSLEKLGLPQPEFIEDNPNGRNDPTVLEEIRVLCSTLNSEQKLACIKVLSAVARVTNVDFRMFFPRINAADISHSRHLIFIDGPGGTGKTYVYSVLCKIFHYCSINFLTVAPTGIAASLLEEGRTCHFRFGIPIDLCFNSKSHMKFDDPKADVIRAANVVIWDEIAMTKKQIVSITEELFRDVRVELNGRRSNESFGECVIVAGGDFRQQGPVVKRGSKSDCIAASVKSYRLWGTFDRVELRINMRAGEHEKKFGKYLLDVGENNFTNPIGVPKDFIPIPKENLIDTKQGKEALIDEIFGKDLSAIDPADVANRAILCAKNVDALRINDVILNRLPGELHTLLSADSGEFADVETGFHCDIEYLNSLCPGCLPPHKLHLKVGCVVMVIRNLNPIKTLVNGSRLIVRGISDKLLDCEHLFGVLKGKRVFLPKMKISPSETDLPFKMTRYQFPVRLSYAMTIAKSQGQSLDAVGVYLDCPSFAHGQMYTAFSRCRFPQNLKIDVCNNFVEVDGKVYIKNVVIKELL